MLRYNPRVPTSPAWRRAPRALAAALWVAALAVRVGALANPSQDPTAPPATKNASTGVYTEAQAKRGQMVFGDNCTGCHNTASQQGEAFAKRWRGAVVFDLYKVLTDTMPKDTPGSLEPKDRVDVIAYLLKINDVAMGATELPNDVEELKKIVIDLPERGS